MTYYERNKEQRKEINRQRALDYYYKNIEKRREYNKNYWKDNYIKLYSKRLLKKNCDDMKLKEYQKYYYEKTKYENKIIICVLICVLNVIIKNLKKLIWLLNVILMTKENVF